MHWHPSCQTAAICSCYVDKVITRAEPEEDLPWALCQGRMHGCLVLMVLSEKGTLTAEASCPLFLLLSGFFKMGTNEKPPWKKALSHSSECPLYSIAQGSTLNCKQHKAVASSFSQEEESRWIFTLQKGISTAEEMWVWSHYLRRIWRCLIIWCDIVASLP